MLRYLLKIAISSVLLVLVSEVSKKTSFWGGLIASLPITSLLALIWVYFDTKSKEKVAELSINIFWFVLPSLLFFIFLPVFINKLGLNTYLAMFLSALITMVGYWMTSLILSKFGIKI